MKKGFIITAIVDGKVKYWSHVHGLHSGYGKLKGFSVYKSETEAWEKADLLKYLFASWFEWKVKPESEIPFIKKQRNRKKR